MLFITSQLFAGNEDEYSSITNLDKALCGYEKISANTIKLFKSGVIEYFPEHEWNTHLKKKYLMKTQLYKDKKTEIDSQKNEALSKGYYAVIGLKNGSLGDSRYILRLRKMLIHIQSELFYKVPIVDNYSDFYFKKIPACLFNLSSKELYNDDTGIHYRIVSIALSMNEEKAYSIEKNIDNAKCYLLFYINNNIKVLSHYHRAPNYSFSLSSDKFIVATIKKVIIGDPLTGSVYYEKEISK